MTCVASSVASFSSPLGFLQAAFPHTPSARLRAALEDAGCERAEDAEEVDILGVIEALLTAEFVKDLEERGLDALADLGYGVAESTVRLRTS